MFMYYIDFCSASWSDVRTYYTDVTVMSILLVDDFPRRIRHDILTTLKRMYVWHVLNDNYVQHVYIKYKHNV